MSIFGHAVSRLGGGGVALSSNLLLKAICAPVLVVDCGRGANAVLYHTPMPMVSSSRTHWSDLRENQSTLTSL